mgnify:CR=1 FL=1
MFAHSPKIVTNGLVLALDAGNIKSYTSGSTTWYDKSGYGNNGTLYNGVGYSSTYGGGLVFDGVDDYVVIPGNGTVNASNPTVELVMTTSTNGGNIIAQGQYGANWGFGVGVKPEAGKVVIFPPTWMYPHNGKMPMDNDKYIMMTCLHYR